MPAGGQPGSNSRGRGGKFRKFTRGGGKHFSKNLRPLDADGNEISMWSADAQKGADDEDDDEDEDSEEESDSDSDTGAKGEASRADRKQDKKARKEAAIAKKKAQSVQVGDLPSSSEEESEDDDMPVNPNHSKAARNQIKPPPTVEEVAEGVKNLTTANRKERESLEALQAKERYRKMHEQGKTDEAKADLARLRLIREQREAESARRQAEKEEREAQETSKRAEIDAKEAKKREAALGATKKGKKPK